MANRKFIFILPQELHKEFTVACQKIDCSKSEVLRRLMEEFNQSENPKQYKTNIHPNFQPPVLIEEFVESFWFPIALTTIIILSNLLLHFLH